MVLTYGTWEGEIRCKQNNGAVHGARKLRHDRAMQSKSLPVAADCPRGRAGLLRPRAVLTDEQKRYPRRATSHLSRLIPANPTYLT